MSSMDLGAKVVSPDDADDASLIAGNNPVSCTSQLPILTTAEQEKPTRYTSFPTVVAVDDNLALQSGVANTLFAERRNSCPALNELEGLTIRAKLAFSEADAAGTASCFSSVAALDTLNSADLKTQEAQKQESYDELRTVEYEPPSALASPNRTEQWPMQRSSESVKALTKKQSSFTKDASICAVVEAVDYPLTTRFSSTNNMDNNSHPLFPYPLLMEIISFDTLFSVDPLVLASFVDFCNTTRRDRLFGPLDTDPSFQKFLSALAQLLHSKLEAESEHSKSAYDARDGIAETHSKNERDISSYDNVKTLWSELSPSMKQRVADCLSSTALTTFRDLYPNLELQLPKKEKQYQNSSTSNSIRSRQSENETSLENQASFYQNPNEEEKERWWALLPPALKLVYNKQGYREEMVDGSTFWRFLTHCTIASPNKTKLQNTQGRGASAKTNLFTAQRINFDSPTSPALLPTTPALEHAPSVDPSKRCLNTLENYLRSDSDQTDSSDAVSNVGSPLVTAADGAPLDDLSETNDGGHVNEDAFQTKQIETVLLNIMQEKGIDFEDLQPGAEEYEEKSTEFINALISVLGPECLSSSLFQGLASENMTLQETAADRESYLNLIVAERRQDPTKQHLAAVWEKLLYPSEQADVSHQTTETSQRSSAVSRALSRIHTPLGKRKAQSSVLCI